MGSSFLPFPPLLSSLLFLLLSFFVVINCGVEGGDLYGVSMYLTTLDQKNLISKQVCGEKERKKEKKKKEKEKEKEKENEKDKDREEKRKEREERK